MPKLILTHPRLEPREIPLGATPVTAGREPENEIRLDLPDVSRRHARVEPSPQGGYRVVDLNSKNGTLLNGRPVAAMELAFGDRVVLGEATLMFVQDNVRLEDALARMNSPLLPWASPPPEPAPLQPSPSTFEDEEVVDASATWQRSRRDRTRQHSRSEDRDLLKERLVRLGLLSQNIASELDLSRLLETILEEVLGFTGFERGLFLTSEDDTGELRPSLGRTSDHQQLQQQSVHYSRSLVSESCDKGEIVVRGRLGEDPGWDSGSRIGLRSAMCIPLSGGMHLAGRGGSERRRKRKARIMGVIYLDSTSVIRDLDAQDRQLLQAVAAQAAIALQNARLYHAASTDPLTGLANRGYMKQILEEEFKASRDEGESLGVLILDLDHFKQVNDTYGHQIGDEVLQAVAKRIGSSVRRDDYAARWGGEEFLVLLPTTDLNGAQTVAAKIARQISSTPISEQKVRATTSIGLAIYPEHGDSPELLIKHADQALYAAKHAGRDRCMVFQPEFDRADHRADPLVGILENDPARTHRNLSALFNTIKVLRSHSTAHEALASVLDTIADLTRARRVLLVVPQEDRLRVVIARAQGGHEIPPPHVRDYSRSSVRRSLEERRALCLLDALGEDTGRPLSQSIDQLGLNSVMSVPLIVGERVLGAVYADDTTARREFRQADLNLFEALTDQLAMAVAADPDLSAALSVSFAPSAELNEVQRLRREVQKLRKQVAQLRP